MTNEEIIEKVKKRMENEVWYQELRLNAKNPACKIKEQKDKEIAINRKELAQSILKLINIEEKDA
tara:strand:+ start:811 stop:1005 length:195 start_codon:yes stop_codon:yes gene_type:complete